MRDIVSRDRFTMHPPMEPNPLPGTANVPIEEVLSAVGQLAEPARELVLLRYVNRLTHREIAERLNLTPEVVLAQLNAALAQLRRELALVS